MVGEGACSTSGPSLRSNSQGRWKFPYASFFSSCAFIFYHILGLRLCSNFQLPQVGRFETRPEADREGGTKFKCWVAPFEQR